MTVLFLAKDHRVISLMKVYSSLIEDVKDLLFSYETTISDLKLRLVERFIYIKVVAV